MEGLQYSTYKQQEHLAKGEKPIFVCVGSRKDFKGNFPKGANIFSRFLNKTPRVHNVDYYDHPKNLDRKNFLHNSFQNHVFSVVDSLDKKSTKFYDCTGLVVVGRDRQTLENISFLSHQDPFQFSGGKLKDKFIKNLRSVLDEIKGKCIPGTIDAVVVGGNRLRHSNTNYSYLDQIGLLDREVKAILGFDPVVVNGPKEKNTLLGNYDCIYLNTKNRRLYLMRPEVNNNASDFIVSDISRKKE